MRAFEVHLYLSVAGEGIHAGENWARKLLFLLDRLDSDRAEDVFLEQNLLHALELLTDLAEPNFFLLVNLFEKIIDLLLVLVLFTLSLKI